MIRSLALIAAIASLSIAAPSRARAQSPTFELPVFGETTFSMTSTTTLRYRGNNYNANPYDDDFGSLYQRFDLALQGDELRLEVRLDAFVPTTVFESPRCPSGLESLCRIAWDVRPERIALRWEHEDWRVELGDSQLVLGRGIALAFRKVDLLAVDTALRGAHVRYDGDALSFRVHGGLANPQNQDPITLEIRPRDYVNPDDGLRPEPLDVVVGGQVGVTLPAPVPVTLEGHAVHIWFEDDPDVSYTGRSVAVAGWSAEATSLADGRLSFYAEADGLRREQSLAGEVEHQLGRAVYANAQVTGDELTVLVEWADYRNFLVAPQNNEGQEWRIFGAPPTLEYEGPQLVRALGNRRGGALRVDYAFMPGPWSVSLNESLLGIAEEPDVDPWDGIGVSHTWATLARRQEYGSDVVWSTNLVAGYRREWLLHDPPDAAIGEGDLDREMIHAQLEVTIGSGDHSFDISADHRWETWLTGNTYREFEVGGASVTYSWGLPLAVTLALRWSDFRRDELAMRQMEPYRQYNIPGGMWYPSLEARWSFDPGTFLKLFVGQTPGGQICSGGVCRTVPAFEGVSLQFVGRL